MATRYRDAGVNIEEADRAVASVKRMARATFTESVLTDIGSFGAAYQLEGYKKPVLICSADGVGTKLKVAFMTGRHDTVGEDLVNHCVNDIAVQGAVPLFFLDYFAAGKLEAEVASDVISGIARGCKANGCALIGGETAEMPGMYASGEYDLAGFIVGAVERKRLVTGESIREGDLLIGLPSTGLHTNGYSLARKVLFEIGGLGPETFVQELGSTVADALLAVHRSYLRPIRVLDEEELLLGAAHITGGGITDNTPRILPKGLRAVIDTSTWTVPPIFKLIERVGQVPLEDFRQSLNLGIGMILAIRSKRLGEVEKILNKMKEPFVVIGEVAEQKGKSPRVTYK